MGRKIRVQQSYTAGFVPYSWFVVVKSANKAVGDDLGFFWPHDQDRHDEAWAEVDSTAEFKKLIGKKRPECGFCGSFSVAQFGDFGQLCLVCDAYRDKGDKTWDRESPASVGDLSPTKQLLRKCLSLTTPEPPAPPPVQKPKPPMLPGASPKSERAKGVIRWDLMDSLKPKDW